MAADKYGICFTFDSFAVVLMYEAQRKVGSRQPLLNGVAQHRFHVIADKRRSAIMSVWRQASFPNDAGHIGNNFRQAFVFCFGERCQAAALVLNLTVPRLHYQETRNEKGLDQKRRHRNDDVPLVVGPEAYCFTVGVRG